MFSPNPIREKAAQIHRVHYDHASRFTIRRNQRSQPSSRAECPLAWSFGCHFAAKRRNLLFGHLYTMGGSAPSPSHLASTPTARPLPSTHTSSRPEPRSFIAWRSGEIPVFPSLSLLLPRLTNPPLHLGTPRLQPWPSQIHPKNRGFSPWGMPPRKRPQTTGCPILRRFTAKGGTYKPPHRAMASQVEPLPTSLLRTTPTSPTSPVPSSTRLCGSGTSVFALEAAAINRCWSSSSIA